METPVITRRDIEKDMRATRRRIAEFNGKKLDDTSQQMLDALLEREARLENQLRQSA
jgi:hypothetical protein